MADLAYQRAVAIEEYPKKWDQMVHEWSSELGNQLWLLYSANYLLNTAGVKWAIDPYSLFSRLGGGPQPDFANDLQDLQLIVITHAHSDHFDLNLLSSLSHLPIQWVVPKFMEERIKNAADLSGEKIIIPRPNIPLRIDKLTITPFEGLHGHGGNGVQSMGYLAEFYQKRWLFLGDTRTYDFSKLPDFGELTGVVGHLWLGKAEALESRPSKLDGFCDFFSHFKTKQLVITHLLEFGREPNELWNLNHFQLVLRHIQNIKPDLRVTEALMGERVDL